jgi:type II secretory ATPase GspE/PulE/Tfp pilus assembly ATPase PilB-like protein
MDGSSPRKRIGDLLVERGLISADQLRIALTEQRQNAQPIGQILVQLGFLTEETLREALSENLGESTISLSALVPDAAALAMIPRELAKRHNVFPIAFDADSRKLQVAIADTNDIVAMDQVRASLGLRATPQWRLAAPGEIVQAIQQFYGHELRIDAILHEIENGGGTVLDAGEASDYSHPVVRLVDALLTEAVVRGASDVHFEPESHFVRVRYRIDGVLHQVRALHARYWSAMLVRLKIMAGMNIAEHRAAQDGRIARSLAGRAIDFRAAVHPTVHGENFVLRVLDRKRGIVSLDGLGMRPMQLELLKLMLTRPEGILLVTGPTGSGKTTTLYSILAHRSHEGVNVMTLEDPVEYVLPLIRQTSLSDAVRMNFADGVRSLMRQDPDIILVGEIRDRDTAEMALRAAMTGHQVLSTLHSNSALRALPRLLDLGVNPDVISGNVIGIVAQRLVRRLCETCRQPYEASDQERRLLGVAADEPLTLYRPVGCERCRGIGFRGRLALMEMVRFDRDIDEMIARRATLAEIERHARTAGFEPLAVDAIRRVRDGATTLAEVARVVDLTELAVHADVPV